MGLQNLIFMKMERRDMPTTRIIEMILWFVKKVCFQCSPLLCFVGEMYTEFCASVCIACRHRRAKTYCFRQWNHEVEPTSPPFSTLLFPSLRLSQVNEGREDDSKWPKRNKDGRQELEIMLGNDHISFEVLATPYSLSSETSADLVLPSSRSRLQKSGL